MKKFMKNQSGISYIEMIVVIAIMVIVASGSIVGIQLLNSGDSKKATKNLYQELTSLRSSTLTQSGRWYALLTRKEAGGQYLLELHRVTEGAVSEDTVMESVSLGARLTIWCGAPGAQNYEITDTQTIQIEFAPGTGSVRQILMGTAQYPLTNAEFQLRVVSGSGTENHVSLWIQTGKMESDY